MSSSTSAAAAAASSSAASNALSAGSNLKIVGIILAITSGLLIGSSFVFKKKGLQRSQMAAGEGVAYLKSPLWWLGMTMMILGEICNFAAYAFVEALVVTPLGALSVVVCAILSSIFLNEKLTFFGWLGCGLCIIGSVIIALNGPKEASVGHIREFQKLFLAPGFLVYASVLIGASLTIIFYFAPKHGKKSMLWYIFVCSMIGGISVSVTTGLGAAIVQTAMGQNQFLYPFMYFLMAFVVVTLVTEVYYLNVALALFNTAMVTPTYYVIFTFFSMVTTVVLFQGLKASASQILTIVMAFFVICVGITILQMSKVDPVQLTKLDRRSTILLDLARARTAGVDEKGPTGLEDPGMDALRGSFGTVGSIIRARSARRMSQSDHGASFRARPPGAAAPYDPPSRQTWGTNPLQDATQLDDQVSGMQRHQLYDAPVPLAKDDGLVLSPSVTSSQFASKRPTIKFDSQDVVHSYTPTGAADQRATHEHRSALGSPVSGRDGYPPMTALATPDSKANLLEIDPPAGPGGTVKQTLPISAYFSSEHTVRSAPPTVNARFGRQAEPRKDSRDIFDKSGTLVTSPLGIVSKQDGDWEVKTERGRERERGRTSRKYPKGAGDDDREESVGLWRGTDEEESPQLASGGIRLVQPGVGNKF